MPRPTKRKQYLKKRKTIKRKRRGGAAEKWELIIPNHIINQLKNLQSEGNETKFIDNVTKINMIGNERGGHFYYNYTRNPNKVIVTEISQEGELEGTSFNPGDFPFPFHTHPVARFENPIEIDNYPNIISEEDILAMIEDNEFGEFSTNRVICNENVSKEAIGTAILDVLAVPCGIFIYRLKPERKPAPKKTNKKALDEYEQKIFDYLHQYRDILTPEKNKEDLAAYVLCEKEKIKSYVEKLANIGLDVNFFAWDEIKDKDLSIEINIPAESRTVFLKTCGANK